MRYQLYIRVFFSDSKKSFPRSRSSSRKIGIEQQRFRRTVRSCPGVCSCTGVRDTVYRVKSVT